MILYNLTESINNVLHQRLDLPDEDGKDNANQLPNAYPVSSCEGMLMISFSCPSFKFTFWNPFEIGNW